MGLICLKRETAYPSQQDHKKGFEPHTSINTTTTPQKKKKKKKKKKKIVFSTFH